MDDLDRAQSLEIHARQHAIASIRQAATDTGRPSARFCVICEEEIPEKRRQCIPGVQLCVDCQQDQEEHP
ncbi:TraR/DksA C4-type zinc finger protein [Desulfoluna butyratoxydans]|uniref:Zinc finger c4 dksa/trar-type n=1 Tax=Desulfoluna butyratoxydans TaxID=231438 RepID=A0A4U8YL94_9BACT|nr:TraR/DksA C4-type zinc finger protein [Desulfoluna butyratoxydans]VFQ44390.1 zinc finger c4 dksa/trar-type [Desulfoluna butyratoxydans]